MALDPSLRRGVKPLELRDLYERASDLGCEVSLTKRNHVRIVVPNGPIVIGALTGSKSSVRQTRSLLRRAGLDV